MPSGVSDAPRSSARLASLTFFLDHHIGRYKVAQLLRAAGANVEVHLDHFGGDIADIEWIPEVARRNWVLITKDQNGWYVALPVGQALFSLPFRAAGCLAS
jgi:hypothetical protein